MPAKGFLSRTTDKVLGLMGYDTTPDSETPIQEARKQRLGKSAKVQTAYEGIFAGDIQALMAHDRRRVQRLEDKTVFGQNKEGPTTTAKQQEEDDQVLIADDISHTSTTINRGNGLLPTLGAMAVGAGLLWAANEYLNKDKPAEPQDPPPGQVTEIDYEIDSRIIAPE